MSDSPRRIVPADQARHLPTWTLPPFAEGHAPGARRRPLTEAEHKEAELQAAPPAEEVPPAPPPPAVDPREVERIKGAAFDEGYAAGYDQGSAAARKEAGRLRALADASASVFDDFENRLAPRLLDLAIAIARQVVRRELGCDRTAVLAAVRDGFAQLTGGETGRRLALNPADVQLVTAHLGDELALGQWRIVEDERIEPGGCRIATRQSEIDATLATRWQRTLAALGAGDQAEDGATASATVGGGTAASAAAGHADTPHPANGTAPRGTEPCHG
ncbi:hypothetical protein GCM10023144_44290 [Pigmentiphaga soli]|uniref:Flagellar assembly protein FliH n=1 Tax=Pigmentiphaga soli TaxID=1007095 RepID=A0ABP8HPP8_9BURK